MEENAFEVPSEKLPLEPMESSGLETRRKFIAEVTVAGAGAVLGPRLIQSVGATETPLRGGEEAIGIQLRVNGKAHALKLDARVTLLDALREKLGLTGSKKGCDHGQCGACTVLVNGRRINSCLSLAALHDDDEVTTIEGIARGEELDPLQTAMIQHDGFQCGYCTPGQVMSAMGLMKEGCPKTDEGIREMMSGNLCRCGAYNGIVMAIREARDRRKV